jgi:hypothetical protein
VCSFLQNFKDIRLNDLFCKEKNEVKQFRNLLKKKEKKSVSILIIAHPRFLTVNPPESNFPMSFPHVISKKTVNLVLMK